CGYAIAILVLNLKQRLHVKHVTKWWGKCEQRRDAYSNLSSLVTCNIFKVNIVRGCAEYDEMTKKIHKLVWLKTYTSLAYAIVKFEREKLDKLSCYSSMISPRDDEVIQKFAAG
ncbi:hypothetical protein CR513_59469, partial [Mucuna pruriens]